MAIGGVFSFACICNRKTAKSLKPNHICYYPTNLLQAVFTYLVLHPCTILMYSVMKKNCSLFALPIPGCRKRINGLYQKCYLANSGMKVNYVSFLLIAIWANPFWQYR